MQEIQDLKLRGYTQAEIAEYYYTNQGLKPPSRPTIAKYFNMDVVPDNPSEKLQKRFSKHLKMEKKNFSTERLLVGKAICGTCGRSMALRAYIAKDREYSYYLCPHAKHQATGQCCKRYSREADVNEAVWQSIRNLMDMGDKAERKIRKKTSKTDKENMKLAKMLSALQKDREKCEAEQFTNIDGFMSRKVDKDEYQRIRAELGRKAEVFKEQITELEAKLHENEVVADDGVRDVIDTLKRYTGEAELSKGIVETLVDKVLIYDPEHIEIQWKFPDEVVKFIEE